MNLIGAHVSGGANVMRGLHEAKDLGLEAFQVFLSAPQAFRPPRRDHIEEDLFREALGESGMRAFVHGPYVMNFGSPKASSRDLAVDLLRLTVEKAGAMGFEGVVLHSGSSTTEPKEVGYANLRRSLLPLLESLPESAPPVLLEPMAGQGNMLAGTVESIPLYLEAVDWHPKLKLCLDTAHLIAAGEALDEEGGIGEALTRLDSTVGLERVSLIHANDSKAPRSSKKDRHENLGLGTLHHSVWRDLMALPGVTCPLILETPASGYGSDLKVLREARQR